MGAPYDPDADANAACVIEAGSECSESRNELRDRAMAVESCVSEDASGGDTQRLAEHSLRRASVPLIGLVRVGEVTASSPTSCAIASMRSE